MLIGIRGQAAEMVDGAKGSGLDSAEFVEDSDTAGELLARTVTRGDVILVKGSRGVRTEKVIEKLLEKFDLEVKAAIGK